MTKGPWHVNAIYKGRIVGDETHKGPIDRIQINARHSGVATVYHPSDARLIAAAPDLYAAAKLWADRGWCALKATREAGCICDHCSCVRAVALAEGRFDATGR